MESFFSELSNTIDDFAVPRYLPLEQNICLEDFRNDIDGSLFPVSIDFYQYFKEKRNYFKWNQTPGSWKCAWGDRHQFSSNVSSSLTPSLSPSSVTQCLTLFLIFGGPIYAPKMHIWHIWARIWARQIWSSGVSLKRSCKVQFRRVGLRSIWPSSQKSWPNFICGPTSAWWPWGIYWSINLKFGMKPSYVQRNAQAKHWGSNRKKNILKQATPQHLKKSLSTLYMF